MTDDKRVYIDTDIRQLCSRQDFVVSLKLENEEDWDRKEGDEDIDLIAIFDGHGTPMTPTIISKLDFKEHFIRTDPIESIQNLIDKKIAEETLNSGYWIKNYSLESGSTISYAKIYRNRLTKKVTVKLEWLGDSPIMVFLNGELMFESTLHCTSNTEELDILRSREIPVILKDSDGGINVFGENLIESKPEKFLIYENKKTSAVTRSLGHHRKLGLFESQKHIIECTTDDDLRIVIMSDGISDVVKKEFDMEKLKTYMACELLELAEKRWKQEWTVRRKNGEFYQYSFPKNGYDDCSCAVWWQRSKVIL